MLVLRVRNVGEFFRSRLFWRKKNIMHAGRDFLTEKKYSNELHIHVTHETDDFRELLQMTWLLTFILKKNQRVTLIDYGFFLK